MPSEGWLELSEAAQILGVHASTLRRWADSGKIPYVRTLSGRRRFERSTLEQALKEMHQTTPSDLAEKLQSKTVDFAHQHILDLSVLPSAWFNRLNDEQLLLFRYSGQHLFGLMMQFISRSEGAETFLDEARRVAGDYGLICYRTGLSLAQTIEAFLYFRRSILVSVQATTGLSGPNDKDGHRLFLRTSDFFDSLLVATIENYSKFSQSG